MNMTLWDPFREMESLLDRYGRSARQSTTQHPAHTIEKGDWMPKVDIHEDAHAFFINTELPGIAKEDVTIKMKEGILTIKGNKTAEIKTSEGLQHRIECEYGSFVRSFNLPKQVDSDSTSATFQNGLLLLKIPKVPEKEAKEIEIKI